MISVIGCITIVWLLFGCFLYSAESALLPGLDVDMSYSGKSYIWELTSV
jgi:hypothetical protein